MLIRSKLTDCLHVLMAEATDAAGDEGGAGAADAGAAGATAEPGGDSGGTDPPAGSPADPPADLGTPPDGDAASQDPPPQPTTPSLIEGLTGRGFDLDRLGLGGVADDDAFLEMVGERMQAVTKFLPAVEEYRRNAADYQKWRESQAGQPQQAPPPKPQPWASAYSPPPKVPASAQQFLQRNDKGAWVADPGYEQHAIAANERDAYVRDWMSRFADDPYATVWEGLKPAVEAMMAESGGSVAPLQQQFESQQFDSALAPYDDQFSDANGNLTQAGVRFTSLYEETAGFSRNGQPLSVQERVQIAAAQAGMAPAGGRMSAVPPAGNPDSPPAVGGVPGATPPGATPPGAPPPDEANAAHKSSVLANALRKPAGGSPGGPPPKLTPGQEYEAKMDALKKQFS